MGLDVQLLHWAALPCAFLLDGLLGDPPRWPHPIRLMGAAIVRAEPWFRRLAVPVLAGVFFAVALIGLTFCTGLALSRLGWWLHPLVGFGVETVLLFYCLSARSLRDAAMEIHALLARNEVDAARGAVAMIVGRDVHHYGGDDIARATVETVAENAVDGVLAPLFFAALGGAPLALAYKMVNTLDSMVGYKNERYLLFGRVAARIDDLANWLPARLSVAIISLAAALTPKASAGQVWETARREGRQHASPNAGYAEAAFAGALGLRLNGPNYYGGVLVEKPWIGAQFRAVQVADIIRTCHLMLAASALGALLCSVLRALVL